MGVTLLLPVDAINEGTSARFTCTFVNAAAQPINGSAVTTLIATLKSAETEATVNSRSDQSVLNTNGGSSVSSVGVWTLTLAAADTALVSGESATGKRWLKRRLTVEGTYDDGGTSRAFNEEISFFVRSLADVT